MSRFRTVPLESALAAGLSFALSACASSPYDRTIPNLLPPEPEPSREAGSVPGASAPGPVPAALSGGRIRFSSVIR